MRYGAKNVSIPKLLHQWREFKLTPAYHDLFRSSIERTPYEKELKSKRDRLRRDLRMTKNLGAPKKLIKVLQQQVADAEAMYAATGRAGKRAGVAVHLK